jgi:hypothetical protein
VFNKVPHHLDVWGSGGTAPCILNFDNRLRWMVSLMPQYRLDRRLGGYHRLSGREEKKIRLESNPAHPARSLVTILRYPSSYNTFVSAVNACSKYVLTMGRHLSELLSQYILLCYRQTVVHFSQYRQHDKALSENHSTHFRVFVSYPGQWKFLAACYTATGCACVRARARVCVCGGLKDQKPSNF